MNPLFLDSQKLCQTHASSFYSAAQFLPEEKRNAAYALYGFSRATDTIVDQEKSYQLKKKELTAWRNALNEEWDGRKSTNSLIRAFVSTCREYSIPRELGLALIEGLEKDLHQTTCPDFDALYEYCHSAGGIPGLFMAYLIHAPRELHPSAIALGIGMQLTNILRDVKEDYRNGRVYLPQNEMEQFGYSVQDIQRETINDSFHAFMAFQIARARAYYSEAEKALPFVEPESRLTIQLCLSYYREILARIEQANDDIYMQRVFVTNERKNELLNESISLLIRSTDPLKKPVRE